MLAPTSWQHFLNLFAPCFTAPGQRLFVLSQEITDSIISVLAEAA